VRNVVNRGGTEGALDLTGRRELGGAQRTLDVRGLDGRWRMVGSGTEGRRRWERNVWRVREMWLAGLARCSEAKLHKSTTMRVDGFAMGAEVEVDGIFGIVSLAFTPDQAQVITNMIRNLLECVCSVEVLSELEDVGKAGTTEVAFEWVGAWRLNGWTSNAGATIACGARSGRSGGVEASGGGN